MMVRRGITILLAVLAAVSAVTVVSAKSGGGVTLNCNSQNITWCSQPPSDQ